MPTPSEMREAMLRALRHTQSTMNSPAWVLTLEVADEATRREAALQLLAVNSAIVRLENAQLADIREHLRANEAALEQGRVALRSSLEHLERVAKVLKAVRTYLGTVERVVTKIG